MISFEWVDRYGNAHALSSPVPIDDEAEAISQEIDQVLERMENASAEPKSELRLVIRNHSLRLQQLRADAESWNCHAYELIDTDAAKLVEYIDKLLIDVQPMQIIAVLYQEHEKIVTDTENLGRILDGEMTRAQRIAVARSTLEPKPDSKATRREVHDWLTADPVFYRPRNDEGGWFEWHDDLGVVHRLLSPRRIEQEIADIALGLRKLLPGLRGEVSQNEKVHALEAVNPAINRLSVLQVDLERFERERDEKEEDEWQAWEAEWKKLRQVR